jgi:transcriptional regulator with XRE-family HTH domain
MTFISERLRAAVKSSRVRQYRRAQEIGIHPSTLSAWLNGIFPVQDGDPRVVQLGAFHGIPASECFQHSGTDDDRSEASVAARPMQARMRRDIESRDHHDHEDRPERDCTAANRSAEAAAD